MMRSLFLLVAAAAAVLTSDAFTPASTITQHRRPVSFLKNSETHMDKSYTAGSGMNDDTIPVLIKNLSKDNFDESLEMLEPLLLNECVGDECELFLGQLQDKASEIGMEIPSGYAPTHH